jgi:6-phosphogluconolactonase
MSEDNLSLYKDFIFNLLKDYSGKNLNLMISGGSLLKCMDDERYRGLDSKKWKIFYADERCNVDYLNFKGSFVFLDKIEGQIYPIYDGNTSVMKEDAVNDCNSIMKEDSMIGKDAPNDYFKLLNSRYQNLLLKNENKIDICLLGIGNNGHICSLWPNSKSLKSKNLTEFVTVDCPMSPERITVTIHFLNDYVKNLFFILPPKDGKPKEVKEPHESILKELTTKYITFLQ